jgi:hypothetical protein
VDLPVMLHHTWTYQALVHDLLDLKLNKIQLEVQETEEGKVTKENKSYDLDSHDTFWVQNSAAPFQNIAVSVNAALKEYKSALDEFSKISGGADLEHYDEGQLLGKTKDLGTFVTTIPQLREKKRLIDMHTNIATSLLGSIKQRELDSYFSVEESIITRAPVDKKELLGLLSSDARGTEEDKLRLFLMYYMGANDSIPSTELEVTFGNHKYLQFAKGNLEKSKC